MATQTRYPQSNATWGGNYAWVNPENAYADDAAVASVTIPEGQQYKSAIRLYYNFGFEIPEGSTINSVTMECEVGKTGGQSTDRFSIQLYQNYSARGNALVIAPTASLAGYDSDDTGNWSVAELNANTIEAGAFLRLVASKGSYYFDSVFSCDYVRITVDYTEPAAATVDYEGGLEIGFEGSGEYSLLNVTKPNRLGTLRLWSPDRATLWAETTNYRSAQIIRRFVANSLLEAYFWKDSDEEYYIPRAGWIEDDEGEWYRIEHRVAGRDTVHVIAYSPHAMLAQRITVPESESYGLAVTGTPDEVVKAFIDANSRDLHISTAADRTEGSTISEVSRYKNLAEEVRRVCDAHGLGERFTLTSEGFEFDTYEGTDRTIGNTDDNPPAIFSVRYDNLEDWQHSISSVDEVTTVYVAGQGSGADRTIVIIGDAATAESRREIFRDARDTDDTDVLTQRGNQSLMPVREALTAKANTSSNLTYNTDYRLGDLVTVEVPERGAEYIEGAWVTFDRYRSADKRITEIIRTYQGGKIDIDLVFGDAPATRADKTAAIKTDLARLEAI